MAIKMPWSVIGLILALTFTKAQPLYSSSVEIYHTGTSVDVNDIVHRMFFKGFEVLEKTINSKIYDLKSNWLRDFKKVTSTVDAFDEHQRRLSGAVSEIKTNITINSKATQSLIYFDKMAFKRELENLSITHGKEKNRTNRALEQLSLLEGRLVNQSGVISNILTIHLDQFRNQQVLVYNVSTIFSKIQELQLFDSDLERQLTKTLNQTSGELKEMLEAMIQVKTSEIFRRISDLTFNVTSTLANNSEKIQNTDTLVQTMGEHLQNLSTKLDYVNAESLQMKKDISNNKEQDTKLLEIVEGMQSELTKLKNNMSTLNKDIPQNSCPPDWSSFGSSCYIVIKQKKSWDDAAIKCLRYGAKLVEIETKEENDFLKQTLINTNDIYWTGGIDDVTEGQFVWASTGSPLSFKDWNTGEPNDYRKNEDCVDFSKGFNRRGHWNDNRCHSTFYFVCEKTWN
ncbi:low affinity immunoglobulin epsilon Fc receptor-like [Saccostrea cucullata]|uniref:low affinity immunoglobulin epsilon Fc receptor-like n=1 Tax=Saccostrea cuccullata TaxID=36930 RepID=UPI002ED07AF3